jgi:cation transport protein ChaC
MTNDSAVAGVADRSGAMWVFAYGSLIWRPGFSFAEMQAARVCGYRRDMCFLSIHYRGTATQPGLVCGLMEDAGAVCRGRAYRIDLGSAEDAIAYLDARELISGIYHPRTLPVVLEDGRTVFARTYVADTAHAQFVGNWADDRKAAAIVSGRGSQGRSIDYLKDLVHHLDALGIDDAHLRDLLGLAQTQDADCSAP